MKFKQHFDKIVFVSKSTKWMSRGIWFDDNDVLNHVVDVNQNFKTLTELPKEFETTLFNELEMEILFCREGVIKQREIPLETIWDLTDI